MDSPRALFFLSVVSSIFFLQLHATPAVSPAPKHLAPTTDFIRTSCDSTLYPELCCSFLAGYASTIKKDSAQLASAAIKLTLSNAKHMVAYVSKHSRQAKYTTDPRAAAALNDLVSIFGDVVEELKGSLKQMRQLQSSGSSSRFQMSNVLTSMSAALTNVDTSMDGFTVVADGPMKDIYDRVEYMKKLTSISLALVKRCTEK